MKQNLKPQRPLDKNLEWLNFFTTAIYSFRLPHCFLLPVIFKLKFFLLWWALFDKASCLNEFLFIFFCLLSFDFFFTFAVDRYFESCASNHTHWRNKYRGGNSCLANFLWYNYSRSKQVLIVKESKYFWLPINIL